MRISPFSLIEKISSFRSMAKIRMDLLLPFIILSRSAARLRKDWENFSRKELKSGRLTKKESMIPKPKFPKNVSISLYLLFNIVKNHAILLPTDRF